MAAVNKNFIIKNGLEVNTDLIFADIVTDKVGIGTTNPLQKFQIGNVDVSGISTDGKVFVVTSDAKVGIGTTNPLEKFQVGSGSSSFFVTTVGSVGLGITNPQYKLHVIGGIGVTDSFVTGVSTVLTTLRVGTGGTVLTVLGVGNSIGVGTTSPQYLFHINSPVSTGQTALYVQGDVRITGDLSVDDITFDDATLSNLTVTEALNVTSPGISTFGGYVDINSDVDISGTLNVSGISSFVGLATFGNGLRVVAGVTTLGVTTVTNITAQNLYVSGIGTIVNGTITNLTGTNVSYSGISTLGTVKVSSGIITATSGIVTYFGDGNFLNLTSNPSRGIGIGTTGGVVGYGITFLDLKGAGVSTTFYNSNTGIATIFFEGGGGSGSIGIGSTFSAGAANGDLFYNIDYGRIFVYYDEVVLGIGADAFWVDAAPFNVGIITSLTNVSFSPGSAISPSMFFIGDNQTGFFSPGSGQFTVVSSGSSVLNVNASGIRVTGIATATDFDALSDENYKENVITVNDALNKVEQLRGVSFDWKEDGRSSYGVIAQELQKVLPELVHGDNPKTVNYNGIIGVLIEAIKELKKEVEELKNTK